MDARIHALPHRLGTLNVFLFTPVYVLAMHLPVAALLWIAPAVVSGEILVAPPVRKGRAEAFRHPPDPVAASRFYHPPALLIPLDLALPER